MNKMPKKNCNINGNPEIQIPVIGMSKKAIEEIEKRNFNAENMHRPNKTVDFDVTELDEDRFHLNRDIFELNVDKIKPVDF